MYAFTIRATPAGCQDAVVGLGAHQMRLAACEECSCLPYAEFTMLLYALTMVHVAQWPLRRLLNRTAGINKARWAIGAGWLLCCPCALQTSALQQVRHQQLLKGTC